MPARSCYGVVDRDNPEAAGRCDRGGEIRKRRDLHAQMRWAGDRLVPTGLLVCAQHMDLPNPQDRMRRLGPDPVPVRDPRPYFEIPPPYVAPLTGLLGVNFILGQSVLAPGTTPPATDLLDLSFTLDVSLLA